MIDLTTVTVMDLPNKTVELRKFAAAAGIKGMSSARKGDLLQALSDAIDLAKAQQELAAKIAADQAAQVAVPGTSIRANATAPAKRGVCTECGRKEDFRASGLCTVCREYAEWENTHSDNGHEVIDGVFTGEYSEGCPVCHPELDVRTARKAGRSRSGMVIVAKGTEMHKSLTFKKAAEAVGWTVEIERETYELPEGTTGDGTRYYATATKGDESISLAWNGRAYDYVASGAVLNGKPRKVRNLKEALRLL